MENYILKKPINFDGEEIKEINLDFDELSYKDLERAEKEARLRLKKKETMAIPEMNKKYLACVAAIAGGVKAELIFSLKANDFTQITMLVMNFLMDGESEEDTKEAKTTMESKEKNVKS
jgi:hypothetical protein